MDINASTSSSVASRSSPGSSSIDAVSAASRRSAQSLSQETESTKVRLSAYGQVKSAVAEVQTAAKGLQDSKQLQTADSARKAAEAFVKAYNAENKTTTDVTRRKGSDGAAGALADDPLARSASSGLQRTVRNSDAELKQAGITRQKDGTLAVDAKAFDAAYAKDASAVKGALGTIGTRVDSVATRQLSSAGTVGRTVDSLNSKVTNLENKQANQQANQQDLQSLLDASRRQVEEQASRFSTGPFASGVAAYKGIFSI
ncbi:MAG: flagellar filament capping protein FliD [Rhodocyclaceae bacterium]